MDSGFFLRLRSAPSPARAAAVVALSIAVILLAGCQLHQPRWAWQPLCLIRCEATIEGDRINEQVPVPQPAPRKR